MKFNKLCYQCSYWSRHFDTTMGYCAKKEISVWAMSVACSDYDDFVIF